MVEKAVAISHAEFDELKSHPLHDNELIAENVDLMYCDKDGNYHCLLVYDSQNGDGLLIESEGASYARYRCIWYAKDTNVLFCPFHNCVRNKKGFMSMKVNKNAD